MEWELRQWGAPNAAAMVASTPMKQGITVAAETRTRRWFKSRNGADKLQPNGKANANGNGHKAAEQAAGNGHKAAKDFSPFAPPAAEVKKRPMKTPGTKPAAKQPKAAQPKKAAATKSTAMRPASPKATTAKKPAPVKPRATSKVTKPKVEAIKVEATKVEAPKVEAKAEAPKVRPMRAARRLPTVADVEAVAKQGPPIVKILRLIQLRAAMLEAQVADENVAKTG